MPESSDAAPGRTDAVQVQLARLRRKFGLALPDKVSAIDSAFAPILQGPWSEEAANAAYRPIHSLAGSSGTYGFPEISALARSIEALIKESLDARATLPGPQSARVADLMARMRELAASAARRESA